MSDPILDSITPISAQSIAFGYMGDESDQTYNVRYVLFSDLPALLEQARADERGKVRALVESEDFDGYEQGQRDERERIRTGVTGLPLDNAGRVDYADLLAVIDGEDRA